MVLVPGLGTTEHTHTHIHRTVIVHKIGGKKKVESVDSDGNLNTSQERRRPDSLDTRTKKKIGTTPLKHKKL